MKKNVILTIILLIMGSNSNAVIREYSGNSWGVCGGEVITYAATWATQDPNLQICGGTLSVSPTISSCSKEINGIFSEFVNNSFCGSIQPPANTVYSSPAGIITTQNPSGNGYQEENCLVGQSSGTISVMTYNASWDFPNPNLPICGGELSISPVLSSCSRLTNGSSPVTVSNSLCSIITPPANTVFKSPSGTLTTELANGNGYREETCQEGYASGTVLVTCSVGTAPDCIPSFLTISNFIAEYSILDNSTGVSATGSGSAATGSGATSTGSGTAGTGAGATTVGSGASSITTPLTTSELYEMSSDIQFSGNVSEAPSNLTMSFDVPNESSYYPISSYLTASRFLFSTPRSNISSLNNMPSIFSAPSYSPTTSTPTINKYTVSQVSNINSSGSDAPGPSIVFNNSLYFVANNASGYSKLFRLTQSEVLTQISNIRSGNADFGNQAQSLESTNFAIFNSELYFNAKNSAGYFKVFKVNTSGAIVQVSNINSSDNDYPQQFAVYNGNLYFFAYLNSASIPALFRVSSAGVITRMTNATVAPNQSGSLGLGSLMTVFNNELYFVAGNSSSLYKLFKMTSAGVITQVSNTRPGSVDSPAHLIVFNNELYFKSNNASGYDKLFKVSPAGVVTQVSNTRPTNSDGILYPVVYNNSLYFRGSNASGIIRIHQLSTDGTISEVLQGGVSSYLTVYENELYFYVSNKLTKLNSSGNIYKVTDINPGGVENIVYLTTFNDSLYFSADKNSTQKKLYKIKKN